MCVVLSDLGLPYVLRMHFIDKQPPRFSDLFYSSRHQVSIREEKVSTLNVDDFCLYSWLIEFATEESKHSNLTVKLIKD